MARRCDGRVIEVPGLPEEAVEVRSLRARCQAGFRRADGRMQIICTGYPLHRRDAGNWQEFDLRWQPLPAEEPYDYGLRGSTYNAQVRDSAAAGGLLRLEYQGHYVELSPLGLEHDTVGEMAELGDACDVAGAADDHGDAALTRQGRLHFADAFGPGLDLTIVPLEQRCAKLVTIRNRPASLDENCPELAELRLSWRFVTDCELLVDGERWRGQTILTDQPVIFESAGGTELWQWRPPQATDAAGETCQGRLRLTRRNGDNIVEAVFPVSWLRAAAYPVQLDPDTYYGSTLDGHIYGLSLVDYATARSTSTGSNSANVVMSVGQFYSSLPEAWAAYRSCGKFETSAIPVNYRVVENHLYLTPQADHSTVDFTIRIHQFNWMGNWGDAGNREADYDGALASEYDNDWYDTFHMAGVDNPEPSEPLDTSYVNRSGWTPYALLSEEDVNNSAPTDNEYVSFHSQEAATQAFRPYLSLTVEAPLRVMQPVMRSTMGR